MQRVELSIHQERLLGRLVSHLLPLDPILGPWVAGGSVRSVAVYDTLDDVHDIDVFFANQVQITQWEARFRELGYLPTMGATRRGVRNWQAQYGKPIQLVVSKALMTAFDVMNSFCITASQFITDGHHVWCMGEECITDARDRVFRVINPAYLSGGFVTKYLGDYGYTCDKSVDELMIEHEEWYQQQAGV